MTPRRADNSGILCRLLKRLLVIPLSFGFLASGFAAEKSSLEQIQELQQIVSGQQQTLVEQKRWLEEQAAVIEHLQESVISQGKALEQLRLQAAGPATESPGVSSSDKPAIAATPQAVPAEVGIRPEPRKPQDIYVPPEVGGILTQKGHLVLEPSVEYAFASDERVEISGFTVLPAILIGSIDIQRVNRNTLIGALTARYGLTNRLEFDVKVPYVWRNDDTITRRPYGDSFTEESFAADSDNLGDIEFGLHWQMNEAQDHWPYLVANFRVKTTTGKDPFELDRDPETMLATELATGTGFWGVEPSLTWILPSDPAVIYGNISYLWHLEDDKGSEYGNIDPGDSYGATIGIGLAVNEKLSLTFGYDHKIVEEMKQDGHSLPGGSTQHVGSAQIGGSYRLGKKSSCNFSLYFGVTEDAPDVRLIVRFPFDFDLFN